MHGVFCFKTWSVLSKNMVRFVLNMVRFVPAVVRFVRGPFCPWSVMSLIQNNYHNCSQNGTVQFSNAVMHPKH